MWADRSGQAPTAGFSARADTVEVLITFARESPRVECTGRRRSNSSPESLRHPYRVVVGTLESRSPVSGGPRRRCKSRLWKPVLPAPGAVKLSGKDDRGGGRWARDPRARPGAIQEALRDDPAYPCP